MKQIFLIFYFLCVLLALTANAGPYQEEINNICKNFAKSVAVLSELQDNRNTSTKAINDLQKAINDLQKFKTRVLDEIRRNIETQSYRNNLLLFQGLKKPGLDFIEPWVSAITDDKQRDKIANFKSLLDDFFDELRRKEDENFEYLKSNTKLIIETNPPDAKIFFDDLERRRDENGIVIITKEYGRHNIKLEREGFVNFERDIEIEVGEERKELFEMEPRRGYLDITTVTTNGDQIAEAEIYLDGSENCLSYSPKCLPLSIGRHTIRIRKKGYKEVSESITITENQTTKKEFTLSVLPGKCIIKASPHHADIRIFNRKGERLDNLNIDKDMNRGIISCYLDPGTYKIVGNAANFNEKTKDVEIRPDETTEVEITLEQQTGTLHVDTRPEDAIIKILDIEGKSIKSCPSPLDIELPVGKYNLEITHRDYEQENDIVLISPNQLTTKTYGLVPLPGVCVLKTKPVKANITVYDERGNKKEFVKDEEKYQLNLEVGVNKIIIQAPGYIEKQIDLQVSPNGKYEKDITLEQQEGIFYVSTEPEKAFVTILDLDNNIKAKGVTTDGTWQVSLPIGKYLLKVDKDDYESVGPDPFSIQYNATTKRAYTLNPKPGTLTISTKPMDKVTVTISDASGNKIRKMTKDVDPLTISNLPSGIYTITVESEKNIPGRPVYLSKDKHDIKILPNKESREYIELDKATAPVEVLTEPKGAEVFVDDELVPRGTGPLEFNLIIGKHKIIAKKDAYAAYNDWVNVEYDKKTSVQLVLPGSCRICFGKERPRDLYFDGTLYDVKTNPMIIKPIESGRHLIRIQDDYYLDKEISVLIEPAQEKIIPVIMERKISGIEKLFSRKSDIFAKEIKISPSTVKPEEHISVSFTVSNKKGNVERETKAALYITKPSEFSQIIDGAIEKTLLLKIDGEPAIFEIPGLKEKKDFRVDAEIRIPDNLEPGDYHIWVEVDIEELGNQIDYNNDFAKVSIKIIK